MIFTNFADQDWTRTEKFHSPLISARKLSYDVPMLDDKVDLRESTSILFHRWNRFGLIKHLFSPVNAVRKKIVSKILTLKQIFMCQMFKFSTVWFISLQIRSTSFDLCYACVYASSHFKELLQQSLLLFWKRKWINASPMTQTLSIFITEAGHKPEKFR